MKDQIKLGKYKISPITKQLEDGRYSSSVSIRTGRGRGSMDRIVRFIDKFSSEHSAASYALDEGVSWVNDPNKYQRGW